MIRPLITELLIRLLGIWLFFDNLRLLLSLLILRPENIYAQSGQKLLFVQNYAEIIISFSIAVLIIKYSDYIAKLIWKDRENEDEIIIDEDGEALLTPMVAVIGLYIAVTPLARIFSELIKYALVGPGYSDKIDLRNTIIAGLSYELILFLFGLFLFTNPGRIINLRKKLRREPVTTDDESE